MFGRLRQLFGRDNASSKPVTIPERVRTAAERRSVQKYVYPPVAEGIPRYSVAEILGEHEELTNSGNSRRARLYLTSAIGW